MLIAVLVVVLSLHLRFVVVHGVQGVVGHENLKKNPAFGWQQDFSVLEKNKDFPRLQTKRKTLGKMGKNFFSS